ncbi:MAG: hypothetical protein ACKV2T_24160 [Kofleriaceae bacterium]
MARPRSLLGLLAYLVALQVRRHPALVAIVCVPLLAFVLLSRGRTTTSSTEVTTTAAAKVPPLQAAVLHDGFAVLEVAGDRHVVELDRNGTRRRRSAIPTVTDTRAVGLSVGAGVVWVQSKKMHVAKIAGDGKLGRADVFGTSVRQICHGQASNDHRWAVGWLEERDERLWFVHGPTQKSGTNGQTSTAIDYAPAPIAIDDYELASIDIAALDAASGADGAAARMSWCAVTSASDYIALFYRVDAKTYVLMCSKKECGNIQTRAPIDPRDDVLDLACQKEGCVMALRTREGVAHLIAFNLRGKATWTKKLGYATRDTRVQLAPAGDRAYLVSLMTEEGPVVERILSKNGIIGRTWQGAQGLTAPTMTWSRDYAMIAYWDGDALGTDVFAMPR